jgi:hypothetical protein
MLLADILRSCKVASLKVSSLLEGHDASSSRLRLEAWLVFQASVAFGRPWLEGDR